jgi:hypothetical protein
MAISVFCKFGTPPFFQARRKRRRFAEERGIPDLRRMFVIVASFVWLLTAFAAPFSGDIVPCPVLARITADAFVYSDYDATRRIGNLSAGEEVEVLRDRSERWYLVKHKGGSGWVEARSLSIPDDKPPCDHDLPAERLEAYADGAGFASKTDLLVFTEIYRQKTHVLTGRQGEWRLLKTLSCSTGKNKSPTTRGVFEISERGKWFYSDRLGSGAMFWVRFNGTYLFHSVAMDRSRRVIDGGIGDRRSSGCVRFRLEDAEWFYQNIPEGTTVVVV